MERIRFISATLAGVGRVLHFARIPGVRCDFGYYFFCDCSFLLSDPHVPIFDTAHTGAPGEGLSGANPIVTVAPATRPLRCALAVGCQPPPCYGDSLP